MTREGSQNRKFGRQPELVDCGPELSVIGVCKQAFATP